MSAQEIADAHKEYQKKRALILQDFDEQRKYTSERTEDMLNPLLSANGDIRTDFAVLGLVDNYEDAMILKRILLDIYGVDTLVSHADNVCVAEENDG